MKTNDVDSISIETRLLASELTLKAILDELADGARNPDKLWRELKNRAIGELVDRTAEFPTAVGPPQTNPCEVCGVQINEGITIAEVTEDGRRLQYHKGCRGKLRHEAVAPIRAAIEALFSARRPVAKSVFDS